MPRIQCKGCDYKPSEHDTLEGYCMTCAGSKIKEAENLQAEAMLKSTTEKTKTKERIITKEYEGVRCGHCGGRSKIGEVWLISEKDWIGDNPICYGHKRCVEDAIAKAEEMLKDKE